VAPELRRAAVGVQLLKLAEARVVVHWSLSKLRLSITPSLPPARPGQPPPSCQEQATRPRRPLRPPPRRPASPAVQYASADGTEPRDFRVQTVGGPWV
jgi:hypothetical protein